MRVGRACDRARSSADHCGCGDRSGNGHVGISVQARGEGPKAGVSAGLTHRRRQDVGQRPWHLLPGGRTKDRTAHAGVRRGQVETPDPDAGLGDNQGFPVRGDTRRLGIFTRTSPGEFPARKRFGAEKDCPAPVGQRPWIPILLDMRPKEPALLLTQQRFHNHVLIESPPRQCHPWI